MKTGQTRDINQNIIFHELISVALWEKDSRNSDHFGSFQIREDALAINTGRRGDIPVNARLNQTFRCDEGIVGDARYTLTYMIRQLSSEPRPQPPQRYRLDLISLTCNDAQQSTDHVYIMANGEIIWESDIRTGQSRDINQNIVFGDSIGVALWEEDAHGRDDYFGSFQIRSNDLAINTGIDGDVRINTRINQTFRRDAGISGDARYTLRYMVRRLPG